MFELSRSYVMLWCCVDLYMVRIAGQGMLSSDPFAVNNHLRTGADKGNPTV